MARKRVILEQQVVDIETGEIKKVTSTSVRGNEETFVMGRATEGFEWIKDLTAVEIKLMMIMTSLKHREDNLISLTTGKLENISYTLDMKLKSVKAALTSLRKKDLAKQVAKGEYLVNPTTFYTGGTKNWSDMYAEYLAYDDITYKHSSKEV